LKKRLLKYFLLSTILLVGFGVYSLNADFLTYTSSLPEVTLEEDAPSEATSTAPASSQASAVPDDTIPPRYPIAKTVPETYQDLVKQSPADLKAPENVKTTIEYDINHNTYIVRTKIGDMELGTPMSLTPQEYQNYSQQQALKAYFKQKNDEAFQKAANKTVNLTDLSFDIGPADRIFGKGGVKVTTQGSAEISMGLKGTNTKDPSLPEKSRKRTFFNFDENVQLNVKASVGTKVNFGMNYNTETQFDFDSKKLKLAYTGDEDEIIKSLEAGNVSMTTGNSLINGGAALFGMKAALQFGKLRVNALLAQQESESKTVTSKGGAQTKPFEITADDYEESRHFFLSHFFYDNYDNYVKSLPTVTSGVKITRIEVWITNKKADYTSSRNIVAFADLGESKHISNTGFVQSATSDGWPYNRSNSLYPTITSAYPTARDIGQVTQAISGVLDNGKDFEKVESARLLNESEYTVNKTLGYISLKTQLQPDEVLGVAYSYTYKDGKTYQVGEFSTDNTTNTTECLYVKLLKGTTNSPSMPTWNLMMKNVYSLGAYSIEKDKFQLNVLFQSDTTGTYVNYLPEGNVKNTILIRVLGADRLDKNNEAHPDGYFDFIDGYTVDATNGRIYFPEVQPFGSYLASKIGDPTIAKKYVYQELYDSTKTVAQQIAEKNKFILRGEYKASSSAEISLGATNVARGSVVVRAAGATLTENVDYTVDYTSGTVTILNESIISSGTSISVSLENQSSYSMQRKTMMGLDLGYDFSKNFTLGGTIMHLSEMPLTVKTTIGDESVKNTLWGFNGAYRGESQWLTNMLDKLPLLSLTKPSQISFNADVANLIAGHYQNKYTGGYSYLDDFESTQSGYDMQSPYSWSLASVPYDDRADALFPEATKTNDIAYGKNRALMAWYYIDGIFTRKTSTSRPRYMTNDMLSNHYTRGIPYTEIYPTKDVSTNENTMLSVLNVAYYPKERGPYNLDVDNVNADGTLANPEKRWGGIMRKIDQSNFETANIQYIEFWMMDPFIYNQNASGGDLYFNLGEVSEDILKDEKKFFENGMPVDGNQSKVDSTVWGKVPNVQSTVYAFDNTTGTRTLQDVGLNGLSTDEEKTYPTYVQYLEKLKAKLSGETLQKMQNDQFSPLNDPAGDNYHYFRGDDYDAEQADILTRYKHYNGTEGNSPESTGTYDASGKTTPDVEDLNQDNTLNETEKYFEYKVSLRPKDMQVGENYIEDIQEPEATLMNGTKEKVKWYLFKIPINGYDRKVGSISDFSSVRFMRMYMTGFKDSTILRFATLQLVRGDWRSYQQSLAPIGVTPAINGTLEVSSVNIEENSKREPVNYVLPPGVSRMFDSSQPQLLQQNEQALQLKVNNLASQDALAVYKTSSYDLRHYNRMQLFTHAEALVGDVTGLSNNDLSVFIRLGSDYKNNYYEYEVPMALTPASSSYSSNSATDREKVWPQSNMLNFRLEILTNLKRARDKEKRAGTNNVSYSTVYSDYDPDNTLNKISVKGNPTLGEVKTIMIGVRNNSKDIKSAVVWVNELRMTDFNDNGGWAADASLNVALSDLGTVNMAGRMQTAGFGSLDQSISERSLNDYSQYSVSTQIELGKFFPEKAKVSIPLYYAYSKETTTPLYDPLNTDIKIKDALKDAETKAEKDSIKNYSQTVATIKSISLNNVHADIRSKTPMPYDPANFSFGYSYSETDNRNPETAYETTKNWNGNFAYNYTPYAKPYKPFSKMKKTNGYTQYAKQLSLNYLPSSINFQTVMTRNYYEIQLRDLNNTTGENNIPVSFSQTFLWDRAFALRWNLTNSLNFSFNSGTNARIEEPYVQVNKKLNPDQYKVWKDSVMQSIRDFGTPMKYDQTFTATYTMPFQYIPVLNWVNGSVNYNAVYNWARSAQVDDSETEIGNTITNQRQMDVQSSFNLQQLYDMNKYLKRVNQKYTTAARNKEASRVKKEIKFEKEIQLNLDSGVVIRHNMLTKKVHVRARGADGKFYAIRFKPLNMAEIQILNKDTAHLTVTIYPGPNSSESFFTNSLDRTARFLMMVRRINISYSNTAGMQLPGYRPEVGDMLGQKQGAVMAPGLAFAFGDVRRSFINDAADRSWLVMNTDNVNPAIINHADTWNIRATLEPITGLKIDLNGSRVDTRTSDIYYMYDNMPEQMGGNFTMTTIAAKSFFKGTGNANNGYASETFTKFLEYREKIANRLIAKYSTTSYPNSGFLENSTLAGKAFSTDNGTVGINSTDVLIPAFLAAYTGQSPDKVGLTAFPSLSSLLPNWRITYDGLIRVPVFKRYLKSLMLTHQYRCSYSVGSFSSDLNWLNAGNGLGFIQDTQTGNPTPSSAYQIQSVNIVEGFNPLLGVDATFLNNVTGTLSYNTTRNLSLSVSSYQIVEALSKEIIVGMGYKMAEFNKVLKAKKSQGFSNDLTVRLDFSYRKTQSLLRKIQDQLTQATSGNVAKTIQFSADYGVSRSLTLRAFYDLQINTPLVSSTAYPTSNSNYGVTLRFSLQR
jgi:cell surface protein SprA